MIRQLLQESFDMARLKEDMHPKLTSDILKLLNSVNIQTVFDFMDQDNDRLQRFSTLSFQVS